MSFLSLYEYKQCAEFIAHFLEYEELEPPNELPSIIPSPYNVLHWQKGDSFDFAMLLCSILTGSGYDALCI